MTTLAEAEADIARLRAINDALLEVIVAANNRLEYDDCLECVEIARSYLQEAMKAAGVGPCSTYQAEVKS